MVTPHHHLGVDDQVDREDHGSDAGVDNLEHPALRDDDHEEAADEEHKEDAEHCAPAGREVNLRLQTQDLPLMI